MHRNELRNITNLQWARVVDYDPFFLCIIHKKGLCPSSGDINRLMMMKKLLLGTQNTNRKPDIPVNKNPSPN
jgi:hypothetical protein